MKRLINMHLLKQPIKVSGTVVPGRGAGLRFPTATLSSETKIGIPDGVYASRVQIEGDDTIYEGATSAGVATSVGATESTIETYIFDYNGDLRGKQIKLELVGYIREMQTFESLAELEYAIEKDIEVAKQLLEKAKSQSNI